VGEKEIALQTVPESRLSLPGTEWCIPQFHNLSLYDFSIVLGINQSEKRAKDVH
jgi:hypothetical protein